MKENLKYIYINDDKYIQLIILLTYESPLIFLEEISKKLSKDKNNGYILMDTLFHSGKVKDRFIEFYWNGKDIVKDSIKYTGDIQDKYLKLTYDYLRDNEVLLNNSVLSEIQKKLILAGIDIK